MIKSVFMDIDGTLISIKRHTIPASALQAIERIRKAGVKVFLCTSRAKQFLSSVSGLEFDGYVCLTGAHCLDSEKKDIACTYMDPKDIADSVAYVQRTGKPYFAIASDNLYVCNPQHPDINKVLSLGGLSLETLSCGYTLFPDFINDSDPVGLARKIGIMQVTAYFGEGAPETEFMSRMPHSHTERWAPHFTDIVPNGVNKGTGIDVMSAHFGFGLDETLAIGDGGNDIPMICHAAVGVAMGNATEDVKRAADFITDDVDNDGLSKALEKYVY